MSGVLFKLRLAYGRVKICLGFHTHQKDLKLALTTDVFRHLSSVLFKIYFDYERVSNVCPDLSGVPYTTERHLSRVLFKAYLDYGRVQALV